VVVSYDGDRPVETMMSGLTHGNHSKYGFGELRVKPITPEEGQKQIEKPNSEH